jgi:hypothetical protein
MAARIVVETGTNQGLEYPIETSLIRIGSDPLCHLRLTDAAVATVAVALEYRPRERRYLVFNRSGGPLYLDGKPLPTTGAVAWPAGQRLQVADGVLLRLRIEGDPAPAKEQGPHIKLDTDEP